MIIAAAQAPHLAPGAGRIDAVRRQHGTGPQRLDDRRQPRSLRAGHFLHTRKLVVRYKDTKNANLRQTSWRLIRTNAVTPSFLSLKRCQIPKFGLYTFGVRTFYTDTVFRSQHTNFTGQ